MKYAILIALTVFVVAGCGEVASTGPEPAGSTGPSVPVPESSLTGPSTSLLELESVTMPEKVVHSEEEWRRLLNAEQFRVLREKGTERPFVNEFDDHFAAGIYACGACGQELFSSDAKFNSGCGWPAFYAAKAGDRVELTPDLAHGMVRTEVTCSRCGSHLGHIFDDAPQTPTGKRFCINSVSLKYIPAAGPKDAEAKQ